MKAEENIEAARPTSPRQGSQFDVEIKGAGRDAELSATYGVTQRGLEPRHVHLMAIGGSIGIGIWVSLQSFFRRILTCC